MNKRFKTREKITNFFFLSNLIEKDETKTLHNSEYNFSVTF